MSRPKFLLVIDSERCKGCDLCIEFCPTDSLELAETLNRFGHHPVVAVRMDDCTGCRTCVLMCPDACIEMYRRKVEKPAEEPAGQAAK